MTIRHYARWLTAVAFALIVACDGSNNNSRSAAAPEPPPPPPEPEVGNIVEVATEAGDFSTLITALETTGLDATLADDTQVFTVFAPTDAAFEALGQEAIDGLLADPDTLSDILLYHVISGEAVGSEAATGLAGSTVETANGASVAITLRDGALFINNAQVVTADVEASNGVIHVIDAVLTPPTVTTFDGTIADAAVATPELSTLLTALQATGLDAVVADPAQTFTVFAPTNAAFEALGADTITALLGDTPTLENILLYHVLAGQAVDSITALSLLGESVETANGQSVTIGVREDGTLLINDAAVITADIVTDNGIVHIIDTVLTPPADEAPGSIVAVASAADNLTTLVEAVTVAELVDTLSDESRTFTVFAPVNDAFAALDQDALNDLLAQPEQLANVLLYHVIADQAVSSEEALALDGSMVEMANGETVTVSVREGTLFVNESAVISADIPASNGVIHLIDAVLLP